ncbi:hypothetical protein AX15_005886 [Amanita polypyramis BW_CC]|nr:hypothetical protein AX15_005886 [Amanita polypyramis BW_CC]
MCIGIWTLEHPEYALILCSNRDEYLDRPTQKGRFRSFGSESADSNSTVLSGLDELACGTWLGINRSGRAALLTNITETTTNFGTSRGSLVPSFLLSDPSLSLEEGVNKIASPDTKFSGFNLILFAPAMKSDGSLSYESHLITNHGAGGVLDSRPLSEDERRCGGVSNGVDGAGMSDWPKVKRATQDLDAVLQGLSPNPSETELVDRLMDILAWRCSEPITERSHLRNTIHVPPYPVKISDTHTAFYGTRVSTVILIKRNGEVHYVERDIWQIADGKPVLSLPSSARVFHFKLDNQL